MNNLSFIKRKQRVRTKLKKISYRSRLSIFKSRRHIYAQIIDDNTARTLVHVSTLDKKIRKLNKSNCNLESAREVGKLLLEKASGKSIECVVFDKGGHKYHGIIEVLANEARKGFKF
jgi:large subunit ribosomal protein L18